MFFITSLIVSSAIISFQAGGIVIALTLKYFENKLPYKPSPSFEYHLKSKKSTTNQWKNLKMLQKERSQYLKHKYVKKWKSARNGEFIWMTPIPE